MKLPIPYVRIPNLNLENGTLANGGFFSRLGFRKWSRARSGRSRCDEIFFLAHECPRHRTDHDCAAARSRHAIAVGPDVAPLPTPPARRGRALRARSAL